MENVRGKIINMGIVVIIFVAAVLLVSMIRTQKEASKNFSESVISDSDENYLVLTQAQDPYLVSIGYKIVPDANFECWETLIEMETGTIVSIPTKIGEDTIGACDEEGDEYVLTCPIGTYACSSPLGLPDKCCPK